MGLLSAAALFLGIANMACAVPEVKCSLEGAILFTCGFCIQ